MSITTALNNALTGLNATSRQTEVVSDNIANALTPGFSRREVEVSAQVVAGNGRGVAIDGVRLAQDQALTSSRWRSDAQLGSQSTTLEGLERLEAAIGLPGDGAALASRAAAFESALLAASNDPSSPATLSVTKEAAEQYASYDGCQAGH